MMLCLVLDTLRVCLENIIILMYFKIKNTLKNNYYHTLKHIITVSILNFTTTIFMKHTKRTKKKYHPYQPSRWWSSGKSLGPRGLLPLWSQVRVLWLLIWWPLETYMVVNFRARGISWGARKLTRTPMLN